MTSDINNELPDEIKREARSLCDDDLFEDRIWTLLAAYNDFREIRSFGIPRKERRERIKGIFGALDRLSSVAEKNSGAYPVPPNFADDIEEMRAYYQVFLDSINTSPGKKKSNHALRWLVVYVENAFQEFKVNQKNVTGFLENSLPLIELDPPTKQTIINARKDK